MQLIMLNACRVTTCSISPEYSPIACRQRMRPKTQGSAQSRKGHGGAERPEEHVKTKGDNHLVSATASNETFQSVMASLSL